MSNEIRFDTPILKADAERNELHVEAYRANIRDTQGDYMSAETVRAMTYGTPESIGIDFEHNGKPFAKSDARVIGKIFDEAREAAVFVFKVSNQIMKAVRDGKINGVSVAGKAASRKPGLAKNENGESVASNELVGVVLDLISLVAKPANRTQAVQFVAKADAVPAWAATLNASIEAMTARVAEMTADLEQVRASRVAKSDPTSIRKMVMTEAAALNEIEIREKDALIFAKGETLESVWAGQMLPGESRLESERRLLREIHQLEVERSALGKSSVVDLTSSSRSAFAYRGGRSAVVRATLPTDNGFLPTNSLKKRAEEEVDLSSLKI